MVILSDTKINLKKVVSEIDFSFALFWTLRKKYFNSFICHRAHFYVQIPLWSIISVQKVSSIDLTIQFIVLPCQLCNKT